MARKSNLKLAQIHQPEAEPSLIRLDIGCGRGTPEGWIGIDAIDFGQKHVLDVRKGLPFKDGTVDEIRSSHFVEHLTGAERVPFFNELHRVLKTKATALIVTPNWSHQCAYGDPTHQWPPMSAWYPLYLNAEWRKNNAPHTGYTCDFDYSLAVGWDESIGTRNMEYKMMAMDQQTNKLRELIVTFTKR